MQASGHKYAYWREDKPKDPGYSHELIPFDFDDFKDEGLGNGLDKMETLPYPGIDTIIKALDRQVG